MDENISKAFRAFLKNTHNNRLTTVQPSLEILMISEISTQKLPWLVRSAQGAGITDTPDGMMIYIFIFRRVSLCAGIFLISLYTADKKVEWREKFSFTRRTLRRVYSQGVQTVILA